MSKKITVQTTVKSPIETVWNAWVQPEHITKWNFASVDWCCPRAENDVRVGGKLQTRMEAVDGSMGFDFVATYTAVTPREKLVYVMEDGRTVEVTFTQTEEGVSVTETFDAEETNSVEMQQQGWQAIIDNFTAYTESL